MFAKKYSSKKSVAGFKAQAIVEFAIVFPILMMLLIGILEVGRYILIFSSATNASRNAVRYASAVGQDDKYGLTKFNYCYGIKDTALKSIFLVDRSKVVVAISYDDGAGNHIDVCDLFVEGQVDPGPQQKIDTGDRVKVTVTIQYKPMVNLVPIEGRPIKSETARTVLGIIKLDN